MERLEIRDRIARNMAQAGLPVEENGIRVQADPYRGWRVAIISAGFEGMTVSTRRGLALTGLENEVLQWVDLLTPEEMEWAGNLPLDVEIEDLPLWPEALARPVPNQPILFAYDLDTDLEKPIVATFYSLRGGVGRSTALAYTAHVLARRGRSVLCVDLDLEAPGLAALFGIEAAVEERTGLLDILISLEQGESPDLLEHIVRVSPSDELYCLPAGVPNSDYARRLRLIDPEAWYRQQHNPLRRFLQMVSELPRPAGGIRDQE